MTIQVANRRFLPSVFGTVLALIVIGSFARLGVWQLGRAEEKRQILSQIQAGQQVRAALTPENSGKMARYQEITVGGRYDPERQILLDNMPSQQGGRAGYRVLTPLQISQSEQWMLIDRGWVPMGETRDVLPDVSVGRGERVVAGQLDALPEPGMRLGNAPQPTPTWPKVMSFPRREDIERLLGHPIHPYIVLLNASQPDGYERIWAARFRFGPERHVGYAVQWFALAVAVLITYVIVSFKRVSK